ncbi:beta-lactamase hydrolase domain-containing protein [Leptothermofonsia sp. ETS-13]|uniref:beta-lactamase hydrolase domain-containing protein n=1 Tax=Leptothermofonsia sp. ETS-13 TaxID=3035696 RepID=UPI003BA3D88A
MNDIKSINDDIAIAMGQPTPDDLQQAAQEGYKSVLNLRSPQEEGALSDEQQQAEAAGLQYVNLPVRPDALSQEQTDQIMNQIDQLPKPLLTHCKSGLRSGAMALMYAATCEGLSAEATMEKGKRMGFDCESSPQMKQFFQQYVLERTNAN